MRNANVFMSRKKKHGALPTGRRFKPVRYRLVQPDFVADGELFAGYYVRIPFNAKRPHPARINWLTAAAKAALEEAA